MATSIQLSMDEIAQRGGRLYETSIRHQVEAGNMGRYLALDIDTGEYVIADNRHDACLELRKKTPNAQIWGLKIGHIAAASFGGSTRVRA
jgi:hypothetical protein